MNYAPRGVSLLTGIVRTGNIFREWGGIRNILVLRNMSNAPREMEDDLKKNPYYEKYANKIHELQKTSPENFNSRMEENRNRKMKPKSDIEDERNFSAVGKAKAALNDSMQGPSRTKALSEVMKMDLIEDMDAEEIAKIWEEYFKHKDNITATIPIKLYNEIFERGKKYPIFVLPLPRGQGYEFFLCQTAGHEVHFTPLINYQAHKENAPECLTMIHFTELQDKGIVLMHGEYNKDVVDAKEAQCLANQFQLYYGHANEKRIKLLERLNYNPDDFKHMDLIAELECLSL